MFSPLTFIGMQRTPEKWAYIFSILPHLFPCFLHHHVNPICPPNCLGGISYSFLPRLYRENGRNNLLWVWHVCDTYIEQPHDLKENSSSECAKKANSMVIKGDEVLPSNLSAWGPSYLFVGKVTLFTSESIHPIISCRKWNDYSTWSFFPRRNR